MRLQKFYWLSLITLILVSSAFITRAAAQIQTSSYMTVKPITPESPMYAPVGGNVIISFEASWTYGPDLGKPLSNALVSIDVINNQKDLVEQLTIQAEDGLVAFNYSSKSAEILTFIPTRVTTEDKREWTNLIVDKSSNVYGLQAKPVVAWWDTFQVSLLSEDTNQPGMMAVTVKVTYQLLPEEGLTLPAWATYSNQTFLPKTVQNASVTINDIPAQITKEAGVYSASSSTLLSTAYIHVAVSQEGWITTHSGFSFDHSANAPIWTYGTTIVFIVISAALMIRLLISRKANGSSQFRHPNFPFFGGILLAITSAISLYWSIVGLEGVSFGFDWLALALIGIFSFTLGIAGTMLTLGRKKQSLVVFAVMVPMIVNIIGVKAALDIYQLANPWPILVPSLALSIACGFFVSNSDETFNKKSANIEN